MKRENVLLHENRVLVADFGIALALAHGTADPRLTDTGMSVGTPHYMSPQQAMGEKHITARNGDELLYRNGTRIMATGVRTRPDFAVARPPQLLFSGAFDFSQDHNWSLAPDGTLIMVRADPTLARQLHVIFNWFEELKRTAPR